jgi:hypothetical protein
MMKKIIVISLILLSVLILIGAYFFASFQKDALIRAKGAILAHGVFALAGVVARYPSNWGCSSTYLARFLVKPRGRVFTILT